MGRPEHHDDRLFALDRRLEFRHQGAFAAAGHGDEGQVQRLDDPKWGPNPDATGDCFVPKPVTFKVAWAGAKDKWPAAYRFLTAFTFSAEDQIPLIEKIDAQGGDLATVVKEWVDANEAKWKPMADAAAASN